MVLLLWFVVGLLSGWLAGRSLEGNGYGWSMDVVTGIGGAVLGGLTMAATGVAGIVGATLTTLAAFACAMMFTTIAGLMNGRTIYSRQLAAAPAPQRFEV